MRIQILSFTAFVLLFIGCATHKFAFDAKKASAYLATHQDRPANIINALSAGRPVVGMTEEEVELCWGTPQKKITGEFDNVPTVSWSYLEPRVIAYAGTGTVWGDVIVKNVEFTNGVVKAWREIESKR